MSGAPTYRLLVVIQANEWVAQSSSRPVGITSQVLEFSSDEGRTIARAKILQSLSGTELGVIFTEIPESRA